MKFRTIHKSQPNLEHYEGQCIHCKPLKYSDLDLRKKQITKEVVQICNYLAEENSLIFFRMSGQFYGRLVSSMRMTFVLKIDFFLYKEDGEPLLLLSSPAILKTSCCK